MATNERLEELSAEVQELKQIVATLVEKCAPAPPQYAPVPPGPGPSAPYPYPPVNQHPHYSFTPPHAVCCQMPPAPSNHSCDCGVDDSSSKRVMDHALAKFVESTAMTSARELGQYVDQQNDRWHARLEQLKTISSP